MTIINNSSMLPALGGGLASIDCTGNLSITNTNGPAVQANFTVTSAENVSITGKCNGFGIVLNTYDNAHSINCSGEVKSSMKAQVWRSEGMPSTSCTAAK